MKRKYYLRGLGFGILITTFVFIMVGPSELSDEEIIQRAKQLGYVKVEETNKSTINLEELLNKNKEDTQTSGTDLTIVPSPTQVVTPEPTLIPEETVTPELTSTETPIPTATTKPTATVKPTATIKPTATMVRRMEITIFKPAST